MFDFQPGLVLPQIYLVLFGVLALVVGLASAPDGWLWHSVTPAAMAIVGLVLAIEAQGALLFGVLPKARSLAISQLGGAFTIDAAGAMFGLFALLCVLWAVVLSLADLQDRFKGQGRFCCMLLLLAAAAVSAPYASSLVGVFVSVIALALCIAVLASIRVAGNPHPPLPVALAVSFIALAAVLGYALWFAGRLMVSSSLADIGVRLDLGKYESGPVSWAFSLASVSAVLMGPLWLLLPGSAAALRRCQLSAFPALLLAAPAAGIGLLLRMFSMAPESGVMSAGFLTILAPVGSAVGVWQALRSRTLRALIAGHALTLLSFSAGAVAALASNPHTSGASAVRVDLLFLIAAALGVAGAITGIVHLERVSGSSAFEAVAGLGRKSPALVAGMSTALLTLAALPPTIGLPGRFELLGFMLRCGTLAGRLMAGAVVAASVISLYYLAGAARLIFAHDPLESSNHKLHPAVLSLLWLSAGMCVLLFVLIKPLGHFLAAHAWMYYRLR